MTLKELLDNKPGLEIELFNQYKILANIAAIGDTISIGELSMVPVIKKNSADDIGYFGSVLDDLVNTIEHNLALTVVKELNKNNEVTCKRMYEIVYWNMDRCARLDASFAGFRYAVELISDKLNEAQEEDIPRF